MFAACLSTVAALAAAATTVEARGASTPVTDFWLTIQPTGSLVDDKHQTDHNVTALRTFTATKAGDFSNVYGHIDPETPQAFGIDGLGRIYGTIDGETLFLESLDPGHFGAEKHALTGFSISDDSSTPGAILVGGDQASTSNWMVCFPRNGGEPFFCYPAATHFINCFPTGPLTTAMMDVPST